MLLPQCEGSSNSPALIISLPLGLATCGPRRPGPWDQRANAVLRSRAAFSEASRFAWSPMRPPQSCSGGPTKRWQTRLPWRAIARREINLASCPDPVPARPAHPCSSLLCPVSFVRCPFSFRLHLTSCQISVPFLTNSSAPDLYHRARRSHHQCLTDRRATPCTNLQYTPSSRAFAHVNHACHLLCPDRYLVLTTGW